MSADTCTRCPHPLAAHGYGCTSGWFEPGPECHCPNDSDGQTTETCCIVKCDKATVTHVDKWGQFYCAEHAAEEPAWRSLRAITDVTSWEAS